MKVEFTVIGEPKAQPRARSFVLRGRGGQVIMSKTGQPIIRVHDPGTAEHWKSQIAEVAKQFVPFELPLFKQEDQQGVYVFLEFIFKRPQAHFRSNGVDLKDWAPEWNTARIDCDNLTKAVLDCLTVLGYWKDDGIVCRQEIMKRYCAIGENSGCRVVIESIPSVVRRTYEPNSQTALKI